MTQLLVKRKSYHRKGYTRKDGTRVAPADVPSASFKVRDRGAEGRTPESKRFFRPKVHTGWRADMAASKRRGKVLKAHVGSLLASGRAMIALSNVQKRINPEVSHTAYVDAMYFFRLNKQRNWR